MSDSALITLEIGGDASGAVEAANAVAEAMAQLDKSASSAGDSAGGASAGLDAAASSAQSAGAAASDTGSAFEGLGAGASALVGSLGGISSGMGSATGVSTELGSALSGVAESGGELGPMFEAAAGGAAVLISAFLAAGAAGASFINDVAKGSEVTGMAPATYETWAKAIEQTGGSQDALTRSARTFTTQYTSLIDTVEKGTPLTKLQREEMDLLGGTIYDGTGKVKDMGVALDQTLGSLMGMTAGQEKSDVELKLFGRGYADISLMVAGGVPNLIKASEETAKLGLTSSGVAATNLAYHQSLGVLTTDFQELAIKAIPGTIAVMDMLAGGMKIGGDVVGFVSDHWGTFREIIANIATGGLPNLISHILTGKDAIQLFSDNIGTVASTVGPAFESVALAAGSAFESLATIATSGMDSVKSVIGSVADDVGPILGAGFDAAAGVIGPVIAGIYPTISSLADIVGSTGAAIGSAFGSIADVVGGAIGIVKDIIGGAASVFFTLGDAASSVAGVITSVFNSIADVVSSVVNTVVDAVNSLISAWSSIPVLGGLAPAPIGGRATGGGVSAGSMYQINEMGQEFFRPSVDGSIIPAGSFAGGSPGGSGGGTVFAPTFVISGNVYGISDLRDQMFQWFREAIPYAAQTRGYVGDN